MEKKWGGQMLIFFLVILMCTILVETRLSRSQRPMPTLTCGVSEKTFENGRYVPYRKWYEVTCESGYNKEGTEGRALIYCRRSTMTFRMNTNYRLTSCVDVDECENADICPPNATCENKNGSYSCNCNHGYRKDETGSCEETVDCPALPLVPRGDVEIVDDGLLAKIECDADYILVFGDDRLTCNWRIGEWQGTIPRCILAYNSCGAPEIPEHGRKLGCHSEGCSVLFLCDEGYYLDGPESRMCTRQIGLIWSDYPPVCRPEGILGIAHEMKENLLDKLDLYTSTSPRKESLRAARLALDSAVGIDLVLMLDRSSSISPADFNKGIEFCKFILDQFGMNNVTGTTRVAAIAYGSEATLEFNLNDADTYGDLEATKCKLSLIQPDGGGTAPGSALQKVRIQVLPLMEDRPGAKRVIFLITDGHTTMGEDPVSIARFLRRKKEFDIYTIGVGHGIDRVELSRIASEPFREHVYPLEDFNNLQQLADSLLELKPNYTRCGVSGNIEKKGAVNTGNDSVIQYAHEGAWPWLAMVAVTPARGDVPEGLLLQQVVTCSGALVCPGWILTAATCVEMRFLNGSYIRAYTPQEITVVMGEHNLYRPDGREQTNKVVEIHLPSGYDQDNNQHNLALLKLGTPFQLNKYIRTICVPESQVDAGEHGKQFRQGEHFDMAGWGTMGVQEDGVPPNPSDAVQQIKIPVTAESTCDGAYPHRDRTSTFCAGRNYQVTQVCRGDAGGPLVAQRDDGRFVLIGVAMSINSCTANNLLYGLFTDVPDHGSWIQNITENCLAQHA